MLECLTTPDSTGRKIDWNTRWRRLSNLLDQKRWSEKKSNLVWVHPDDKAWGVVPAVKPVLRIQLPSGSSLGHRERLEEGGGGQIEHQPNGATRPNQQSTLFTKLPTWIFLCFHFQTHLLHLHLCDETKILNNFFVAHPHNNKYPDWDHLKFFDTGIWEAVCDCWTKDCGSPASHALKWGLQLAQIVLVNTNEWIVLNLSWDFINEIRLWRWNRRHSFHLPYADALGGV